MRKFNINIPYSKDSIKVIDGGEFEYSNPIEKFFEARLNIILMWEKEMIKRQNPSFSDKELNEFLYQKAQLESKKDIQRLLNLTIPHGLIKVLEIDLKKEQVKSLKGISLTSEEFQAFILKAFLKYGYKYSLYRSEHYHKGLDINEIPTFAHKDENGSVISSGDTDLTRGEIKHMIDHRKMVVSKFLDKGDKWHCFFLTYKSLKGEEFSYADGQPHMHYISHAFGKSRQEVLEQLKSAKYKLGSVPHIDYYTHRNPKR